MCSFCLHPGLYLFIGRRTDWQWARTCSCCLYRLLTGREPPIETQYGKNTP